MKKAIFLSLNALGDTLCTTPVVRAFRRANPGTWIIYVAQAAPFCRVLDGNPDIDLLVYSERMYFQGIPEDVQPWLRTLPLDLRGEATLYRLDLRAVCTTDDAFRQHISRSFAQAFDLAIESTRPIISLSEQDRRAARIFATRPYVVFSLHSVANPDRPDGQGKRKDWPLARWQALADAIHALGEYDIYVVGSERDHVVALPHTIPLYGLSIKVVAALLERAACVVTVENGIAHLCAAVDAPTVIIYSNLMPPEWAAPPDPQRQRVLYGDPIDLEADAVSDAVRDLLQAERTQSVA